MAPRNLLFRAMYWLGLTPWDGHPLPKSLRDLLEGNGSAPMPAGAALDLGCGTGDNSIFLAQHGWQVTGVDFVPKALAKARVKARANNVDIRFVAADITRLTSAGLGPDFDLIVDNGCLHGMGSDDRKAYVREVTAVATAGTKLRSRSKST